MRLRSLLLAIAAIAVSIVMIATSPDGTEQRIPSQKPSVARARVALKQTLREGFHFVETDNLGYRQDVFEGDFVPPNGFQQRIHWDAKVAKRTGNPYTDERAVGINRYVRRSSGEWEYFAERFYAYPVQIFEELLAHPIRVVGDSYQGTITGRTATFRLAGPYVVEVHDDERPGFGYDTVFSRFGDPIEVDVPEHFTRQRVPISQWEAKLIAHSFVLGDKPDLHFATQFGFPLKSYGYAVAPAYVKAPDGSTNSITLVWHDGIFVGLAEPFPATFISGWSGGTQRVSITYQNFASDDADPLGSLPSITIEYRMVGDSLVGNKLLPPTTFRGERVAVQRVPSIAGDG